MCGSLEYKSNPDTDLSGNVKLVHHLQLVVHPDAALDQVKLAVLKVAKVKLQDLGLLGARHDL